MANVLIRWQAGSVGTDRNKGDIVDIRPDDMPWGDLEAHPIYLRVQVTGLNHESPKVLAWAQPEREIVGNVDPDTGQIYDVMHRKGVHILWADLPQATKDEILIHYQAGTTYVTTKTKVRNFLKRKFGSVEPPGMDD
jgi:hypothetical protein